MSLLAHHARELYDGSGIDPAVVAARGCRSVTASEVTALGFAPSQCRAGLLHPQWTLAGAQVGYLLKPDNPRIADGKPLKYEAPAGSTPHFDIHPDARYLLHDVCRTLYFTEGNKKADALWSRREPCVSIPGVWMFLSGRLVVPDLDEIALCGRLVRVVFDSDVTRKPEVAEALLRFCAALSRRGARVEVVYLPAGPDGAKTGLDDWFVRHGGTVAGLDDQARPWRPEDGPGVWLRESMDGGVAKLRRQLAAARADASALASVILNLELTRAQLLAAVAVATETQAKLARGDVEASGQIVLSASEIADDWRPKPETGERVGPFNPRSRRRPRMDRKRVGRLMTEAVAAGLIRARPLAVTRRHDNGSTYKATDWVIEPSASVAAALAPWITHGLSDPKTRKPRTTEPCPECGEHHPIVRQGICTGCGTVTSQRTTNPEPPAPQAEEASDVDPAREKSSLALDRLPEEEDSGPHSYYLQGRELSLARNGAENPGGYGHDGHGNAEDVLDLPAMTLLPRPTDGALRAGRALTAGTQRQTGRVQCGAPVPAGCVNDREGHGTRLPWADPSEHAEPAGVAGDDQWTR